MDARAIIVFIILLPCSVAAEVYECSDGKYQAEPCDAGSTPIDLSGVGSTIISNKSLSGDLPASKSTAYSMDDKQDEITSYIRKQQIKREISQLETDRRSVFKSRDAKIAELRLRGLSANNNLAGATWQQSLAQEMSAVMQQADTSIKSIDSQIESLNQQLTSE